MSTEANTDRMKPDESPPELVTRQVLCTPAPEMRVCGEKLLVSAAVAGAAGYAVVSFLDVNAWIQVFLGGTVVVAVYCAMILLLKAVDAEDIQDIRTVLKSFGSLRRFAEPFVDLAERLVKMRG